MKGLTLSVAVALGGLGLAACAPRMHNTHYERWASQDAKRKADAAAEAKKAAAAPTPGAAKAGTTAAAKPAAPTAPPPPADGYNSLSGGTPAAQATKTATPTRAVKPTEDDDIY